MEWSSPLEWKRGQDMVRKSAHRRDNEVQGDGREEDSTI